MFHALSKLLYFLTTPLTWIVVPLVLGLIFKTKKWSKKLTAGGVVVLYLFSNAFIQDEILRLWEPEMSNANVEVKYELAIVLGGYSVYAPRAGQVNFFDASDRVWEAFRLYQNRKVKQILLSGGQGQLLDDSEGEASFVGRYLLEIGMNDKDLIIEARSRNTRQNAIEAKNIIDSLGIDEPILLITSTTHMPRAQACFEKLGLNVTPYYVDGMVGERRFFVDHLFIPQVHVLMRWNIVIHEWIGMIVYKIMGYA